MADQTRTKTRIYELTETTTLSPDMNLAVDTEDGGTKRVQLSTLIDGDLNTAGKAADAKATGDALATKVSGVKVNGASVVSEGEANIPLAGANTPGVAKVDEDYGLRMGDDGTLKVYAASDSVIKAGSNSYRPVAPNHVHEAAFYGLAKAAGDSTQASSSNPVGTYTDDAKEAIQDMLGVTEELTHVKENISELEEGVTALGFSVVEGAICVTYTA